MRRFYIVFLILISIFFFISNSWGTELSLTAKANKTKLRLGENFELQIEITGNFRITPKIEFPNFKDFEIISQQSSHNFNIKGGEFLSEMSYTFILKPKSEGRFMIEEIKVDYRGKIYRSEPIEIVVLPGIEKDIPKEPKKKYPPLPKATL